MHFTLGVLGVKRTLFIQKVRTNHLLRARSCYCWNSEAGPGCTQVICLTAPYLPPDYAGCNVSVGNVHKTSLQFPLYWSSTTEWSVTSQTETTLQEVRWNTNELAIDWSFSSVPPHKCWDSAINGSWHDTSLCIISDSLLINPIIRHYIV
jgi:hypothetical protein